MGRYTAPHGWDGANWRKLPLLWGYSDVYSEYEENNDTGAETTSLVFSVVPEGEIWIISHVSASATTADPTLVSLLAYVDGVGVRLAVDLYLEPYLLVKWTGNVVLKKDDRIGAIFEGCAAGNYISAHAAGYKMKVAE